MDKKVKQRYNYGYLQTYCQENKVELLEDYSNSKINRDVIIKAKCIADCCNDNITKKLRLIIENGCYCKRHLQQIVSEKKKKTCLEKYGVEHSFQSENNKEKTKKTMLNKYGVEHISKVKEIQDKIKFNNKEKYGVEFPLQSKNIREKAKNTMVERFGINYAWE
jgi:hypothetical protein